MFKSDNFVFCSEKDADYTLEAMKHILNVYGSVTIADAYDLIDFYEEPFLNGNEFAGWTDLNSAKIEKKEGTYLLILPDPIDNLYKKEVKTTVMNIDQMREQVGDAYKDSVSWKNKVKKMPDNQIIALWHRFKSSGLIK